MDVAILGGGIAGLATAISLAEIGMTVNIFERRKSVHNLGAGIVCWPNASFVLSELGILEELQDVAGPVTAMRRISQDGLELGSLDIQQLNASMNFPSLAVLRVDLMQILLRRVQESGIPIHYQSEAINIVKGNEHAHRVVFSNRPSIRPDIIIGADGRMNSIARKFVVGNNQPVFQGFLNWIGVYQSAANMFEPMEIEDYWGVGSRFGIVPVSNSLAYWAGGVASTVDRRGETADPIAHLQASFQNWPAAVQTVITYASDANTKRLPLYDHDPLLKWHKGNVLLIGDAAHAALPTSGQGAAQALEDAWCLARELAAAPSNPEAALTTFTNKRREKTTGIIMSGRALAGSLFSRNVDACAARDKRALQTDYAAMATGMATSWSSGLPIGV